MKVGLKIQQKGVAFLSVAEAIQLMIDFAGFVINLLTFIVGIILLHHNKKK